MKQPSTTGKLCRYGQDSILTYRKWHFHHLQLLTRLLISSLGASTEATSPSKYHKQGALPVGIGVAKSRDAIAALEGGEKRSKRGEIMGYAPRYQAHCPSFLTSVVHCRTTTTYQCKSRQPFAPPWSAHSPTVSSPLSCRPFHLVRCLDTLLSRRFTRFSSASSPPCLQG